MDSTSCHITKINFVVIVNNLDPNKAHGHDKISIHIFNLKRLYIGQFP